jgi:hypothetical protein
MAEIPLTTTGYLVVGADGAMRVTKKRVRLRLDEVAFPLTVRIPRTWGRVQPTSIDVTMPEPPDARVTVGDAELDEDA